MSEVSVQPNDDTAVDGRKRAWKVAPFLVWPVGINQFYMAIMTAMMPVLMWGVIIFGWRALGVIMYTLAGAAICHVVLRRTTTRGKRLVASHTAMTALLIAGLAQPIWPWTIMAAAGAIGVLLIWLFAGPGRELGHPALLVTLLLWPLSAAMPNQAILVRDRLIAGDVQDAAAVQTFSWPRALDLDGAEAVKLRPPTNTVAAILDSVSESQAASKGLPPSVNAMIAAHLPWPVPMLFGLYPSAVATGSAVLIIFGGLYLIYRGVLRPRSSLFFVLCVFGGLCVAPLSVLAVRTQGIHSVAGIWHLPTEHAAEHALALMSYEVFSSDVLYAAVFILAMPGTVPITRRGRRWFLLLAGLITAVGHRLVFPTPIACYVLVLMQPLAPLFDRMLKRRSWLAN